MCWFCRPSDGRSSPRRPPQLSGGWGGLRWRGVRRPRVGARTRYRWDGRRWLRLSGNGSRARRHRRHRRYWVGTGTRRHRVLQLHGGCGHRMIPSHRCPSKEAVLEPMGEFPARWAPALAFFMLRFAACTCLRAATASATHGPLELGLGHLRAALDVLLAGLVVELVPCASARSAMRPQTAPAPRGDVFGRCATRLFRLPGAGPFLVDGTRCDLLGGVLVLAPLDKALLDVVVLALSLVAPCSLRHAVSSSQVARCSLDRSARAGCSLSLIHICRCRRIER